MDLIERCDKCKLSECFNCEHSWADVQEIKEQLAEKDREIEELKETLKIALEDFDEMQKEIDKLVCGAKQMLYEGKEIMQSIRHQVCEEIRAYLKENLKPIHSKLGCFAEINREDLFDKLDQIEGEE